MKHRIARLVTLLAVTLVVGSVSAFAEEPMLGDTVAEHQAMARSYTEKVASWKAEIALHREMAANYAKKFPDSKTGVRNPWAVKMEKHCQAIIKDLEKLVADGEWAAKSHELRAKELEGK